MPSLSIPRNYFRLGEEGKARGWPFIQTMSRFRFEVGTRRKNMGDFMQVEGKLSIAKEKGNKQNAVNTMKITPGGEE